MYYYKPKLCIGLYINIYLVVLGEVSLVAEQAPEAQLVVLESVQRE